jgi:hypothetical protein
MACAASVMSAPLPLQASAATVVREEDAIDWERSDYDRCADKEFCEHMIRELLPEVPFTIFRPSIVLRDSRHAETTQFDMVRLLSFWHGAVVGSSPADRRHRAGRFVADSIVTLHQKASRL